jgi:hypothetical protein
MINKKKTKTFIIHIPKDLDFVKPHPQRLKQKQNKPT